MSSYRLMRAALYDESLMLVRGIGEIANLLWLFNADEKEHASWSEASRKDRLGKFRPAIVRSKLNKLGDLGAPIDDERYRQLCEIGTHPVPGFAPGHYSGPGRPILGGILQPVGVYVCVTEISFAIAMCAFPVSKLPGLPDAQRQAWWTRLIPLSTR